ncbi:DNA helicase [Helicobacter phage Pt1293U]|nr:DNA helicase [Helicobacter phage Pt1293U]
MKKHGKNHNELIKELLLTKQKKMSLRESNLKELERIKRKKSYKLAQIVRLAILKGLKQFKKENLLVHLTLREFDSFLEILEEKNRKKH